MAADGTGAREFSQEDIKRLQRTAKGLKYEGMRDKLDAQLENPAFRAERTAQIRAMRSVAPNEVHSNSFMANLSKMYRNDDYIGELVMPVCPVDKLSNNFASRDKRDRFNAPDDEMSFRSEAEELNESSSSDSYTLKPYGLTNSVEAATIANEDPGFDEMLEMTEAIWETLALKREIRIATAVTTAANYSGNTVTLAGADQWNSASGGNPIKNIQDGLAECFQGAGPGDMVGVTSLSVWNVLARHAQTMDLFKYVEPGLTKMDKLARELGLSKIVVGASRKDTANKGQTASYSRIWGKHFAIVRVARRPALRNASFGYTLRRAGDPVTVQWFDPKAGLDGSYFAKSGSFEQQKVIAGDTGYLFVDAIS